MKILEHTSTHLTLQDSAISIWFGRLIGSVFLFMGCVGLFLLIESFEEVLLDNLDNIIEELLGGIGFMIFNLTFGITFVFFLPNRTVWFDKHNGKLIIKAKRLLGTKIIEYPICNITNVVVEKNYISNSPTYTIFKKIASKRQKIRLSNMRFKKAEQRANLIRSFLNMPL
jgi:hypothetical protein